MHLRICQTLSSFSLCFHTLIWSFLFPVISFIHPHLCLICSSPDAVSRDCYVFISPEFSLSLCPSTRLCGCVSCVPSLNSHYSFYLSSPVSFPQHDCDRLTDPKKEDGGAPPPPTADLGLPFAGFLRRRPRLAQPTISPLRGTHARAHR